jgi:hypothetical protein
MARDFEGDAHSWALAALLEANSATSDIARGLEARGREGSPKTHFQNARRLLREAEGSLTRALVIIEMGAEEQVNRHARTEGGQG